MKQINELELHSALADYCESQDEPALDIIIQYVLQTDPLGTEEEISGAASDLICSHALDSLVKKGILDVEVADNPDDDTYFLTDLGARIAINLKD